MNHEKFVEFSRIQMVFGSGKARYHALDGVDLSLHKGEFVTLIGHSGCGKSTLLNLLAGLNNPTSGAVKVGGKSISGPGLDRAVVFQSHSLLPWLSVQENIRIAIATVATSVAPASPEASDVAGVFWKLATDPEAGWEAVYPAD